MEFPDALRENESLETLHISRRSAGFGDYLVFLATCSAKYNTKRVVALYSIDEDETGLIPVLKKNYRLEEMGLNNGAGDIHSILS
jgi:hypothetical protein